MADTLESLRPFVARNAYVRDNKNRVVLLVADKVHDRSLFAREVARALNRARKRPWWRVFF